MKRTRKTLMPMVQILTKVYHTKASVDIYHLKQNIQDYMWSKVP
jgi:hypothetical protein